MRASSWIPAWIKVGKQSDYIKEADDPPFNTQSFHACVSDDELLDKLAGKWCPGQAFYRGDLCFIQQSVESGSEWLTIKQDAAVESISFGRIIKTEGRAAGQELLDRLRSFGRTVPRTRLLARAGLLLLDGVEDRANAVFR